MPKDYHFVHLLMLARINAGPLLRERYNGVEDVYKVTCGKHVSMTQQPERWTSAPPKITCQSCLDILSGRRLNHRRGKSLERLPLRRG